MASVPFDRVVQQSLIQYIRSFVRALPRLRHVVDCLRDWDRIAFDPRKDAQARIGQVRSQLFVGAIALIHLVTSARMMRRVMRHHCKTYAIATQDCPAVGLANTIVEREGGEQYARVLEAAAAYQASDYRPAYARALRFEDEGDFPGAAREYRAIALLPRPGPYCLLRAGFYSGAQEAIPAYAKAVELYPGFALGKRKLAGAVRGSDPLLAAAHYSDALSQSPELEYGEQSWVTRRGSSTEVERYRGFRIYVSPDGRRCVALPVLFGSDERTMQVQTWSKWKQFVGLALLRLHKDEVLKRFRRPARRDVAGAEPKTPESAGPSLLGTIKGRFLGWLVKLLWLGEHQFRHWTGRHLRYVRFGLSGRDPEDVKKQIDWIHAHWMIDGTLDGLPSPTQAG